MKSVESAGHSAEECKKFVVGSDSGVVDMLVEAVQCFVVLEAEAVGAVAAVMSVDKCSVTVDDKYSVDSVGSAENWLETSESEHWDVEPVLDSVNMNSLVECVDKCFQHSHGFLWELFVAAQNLQLFCHKLFVEIFADILVNFDSVAVAKSLQYSVVELDRIWIVEPQQIRLSASNMSFWESMFLDGNHLGSV